MKRRAFTIIELLVVVSIIAMLVGILLPAVYKARDTARTTQSANHVRNLATAHVTYTNEFKDRQFQLIDDTISSYGDDPATAFQQFQQQTGVPHPVVYGGWGRTPAGAWVHFILESAGLSRFQPISFSNDTGSGGERFGSFRLLQVEAFHNHLTGRFYDPIYYAPKDEIALATEVQEAFTYPDPVFYQGYGAIWWSSYCLSPAAMFHPSVMRRPDQGGWQDPWSLPGGFRAPSFAQARYPHLKTQLGEHHWLQNTQGTVCNPAFVPGTYDDCEPYYFNHSVASTPIMAFYDNHVGKVGTLQAQRADARMLAQSGNGAGLWSRDTHWQDDGYFITAGYDQADTSFHIFTTEGILGRDILAE